ncbi:MAG: winged helix-turn-helix transcriptional regulator [Acidobacteriaceae bacterium]
MRVSLPANSSQLATVKTKRVNKDGKVKPAPRHPPDEVDPKIEKLVREIIERVADKWTMLILEVLEEHGAMRFTSLGKSVHGISQKMLTQTVRQMESDGLVKRTIYPVIPPRVEYQLTSLGRSLGAAFCGVWIWAEQHHDEITRARRNFSERTSAARSRIPESS